MRAIVIAMCAALLACGGSARRLLRDDEGGVLSLEGNMGEAHADAERQMTEHCGAGGHHVLYDGDVQVPDEETHERSVEDRTAQTRTVQSGDHTSWVEGQPAYAESGVTMSLDGDPQLYSAERGARTRTMRTRTERHLEYECEETSGGESESDASTASPTP